MDGCTNTSEKISKYTKVDLRVRSSHFLVNSTPQPAMALPPLTPPFSPRKILLVCCNIPRALALRALLTDLLREHLVRIVALDFRQQERKHYTKKYRTGISMRLPQHQTTAQARSQKPRTQGHTQKKHASQNTQKTRQQTTKKQKQKKRERHSQASNIQPQRT
jgi:hypothetical protein